MQKNQEESSEFADYLLRHANVLAHTHTHKHTVPKYHIKELLYGQVSVGAGSSSLSTHTTSNSPLHAHETGPSALQTKVVPPLRHTKK